MNGELGLVVEKLIWKSWASGYVLECVLRMSRFEEKRVP